MNNKDDANIQISADVLNLLVIRNNPDEDLEGLTDQLRADWLAAGTARPDPGFTVPDLAREVPAQCADPALAEAASNLQTTEHLHVVVTSLPRSPRCLRC